MDKVVVVQMGARRGYELARVFKEENMLAWLSTDLLFGKADAPLKKKIASYLVNNARLSRRTVDFLSPFELDSNLTVLLISVILRFFPISLEKRFRIEDFFLGLLSRKPNKSVSVIITTAGNGGLRYLKSAKKLGCKIITDVVITPRVYEIMALEMSRHPLFNHPYNKANRDYFESYNKKLFEISDILLCPSQSVADAVVYLSPSSAKKCRVIPYGLGNFIPKFDVTVPKTILFVGNDFYRKGVSYLAEASSILRSLSADYVFLLVGDAPDEFKAKSSSSNFQFLGSCSSDELANLFSKVDVFCLPSLAEGMASVVLEALVSGVPVVVSYESGAPISHGDEGFIVDPRDPYSIAMSIDRICSDRTLRSNMSKKALEKAQMHSSTQIRLALKNVIIDQI